MELTDKVQAELAPAMEDMGYDVVRVSLAGGDVKTLQVMVERKDRQDMTLKDCQRVSNTASALLDVADLFAGRWTLEVSSPGLDRPLVKPVDYNRFKGLEAKIELNHDVNGRRRFKGLLLGEEDGIVRLDFEGAEIAFRFEDITKAKLMLTDELLNRKIH